MRSGHGAVLEVQILKNLAPCELHRVTFDLTNYVCKIKNSLYFVDNLN